MDETEVRRTVGLLVHQSLEKLEWAAELLRGPETAPSPKAMRTEMTLSRVIDMLRTVREG